VTNRHRDIGSAHDSDAKVRVITVSELPTVNDLARGIVED
jgi:hypothetical protein